MKTLKNLDPKTRKTVTEVGVLLVVLIATLAYFAYTSQPADIEDDLPTPTSGIETDFNFQGIDYIDDRQEEDGSRPFLSEDSGKPNPFTF